MRTQLHQQFNDKTPCGGTFLGSCFAKTQWAGHPNLANKHFCPAPLSATELFPRVLSRGRIIDVGTAARYGHVSFHCSALTGFLSRCEVSASHRVSACNFGLPVGPSVYWRDPVALFVQVPGTGRGSLDAAGWRGPGNHRGAPVRFRVFGKSDDCQCSRNFSLVLLIQHSPFHAWGLRLQPANSARVLPVHPKCSRQLPAGYIIHLQRLCGLFGRVLFLSGLNYNSPHGESASLLAKSRGGTLRKRTQFASRNDFIQLR